MSRPEHMAPPESYYDEKEAGKYTRNTRIIKIQSEMTERCLELIGIHFNREKSVDLEPENNQDLDSKSDEKSESEDNVDEPDQESDGFLVEDAGSTSENLKPLLERGGFRNHRVDCFMPWVIFIYEEGS